MIEPRCMDEKSLNPIINNPILGYAYHRIVLDDNGKPVDYIFLEVNKAFETLTGLIRDNIINKSVKEILPNISHGDFDWIGYYGEVALNGMEKQFDQYALPQDKWFRVQVFSPEKYHFTTMFIDISEMKKKEEELKKSEEKFRLLSELSSDVIWVYNLTNDKFLYVSPSIKKLRGLEVEEALKQNMERSLTKESLKKVKKDVDVILSEFYKTGKVPDYYIAEVQQPHKTGGLIWVEMSCNLFLNDKNEIQIYGVTRNIQQRKEFELELKASEEKYRKLIDNSHEIIYQLSTEGVFLFVSPAWTHMLGHTTDQVIGHSITEFVHQDDWGTYLNAMNELLNLKVRKSGVEYRVKHLDGSWHWHSSSGVALYDDEGNIIGVDGIARDITEQRRSNELLRKLSLAVEQSPVSVVITDLNANIEYVNKKFSDITGYSYDELKGKNPRVLRSGSQSRSFYKNMWDTLLAGQVWKGEFLNRKKNGDLFWELASISPIINEHGVITHYLGIKEDISSRKLSEKQLYKFSKVVEQSPNMILITDAELIIEYVNPAFTNKSFYNSEDIVGRPYKYLKLAKTDEVEYEDLWETLAEGKVWHSEIIDKRKNGELYWLDVFINPIFDDEKKIVNYVSIMQDISNRKRVEEELQELNLSLEQKVVERTSELSITNEFLMNEVVSRKKHETELKLARFEAEKANKAKSEFISRMSHELRTPMNSILGFAQLFSMGELSPTQRKGVDHILNSGNHLLRLINEVLDISKIEAGKLTLSVEQIKVREAISEAIDLIHPLTISTQISVVYETREKDDFSIKADKQRLIQILVNILNNAIKFNKKDGTVIIATSIEKGAESKDNKVIISITDSGIGIAEKDLSRLFVPFERLGNTELVTEGTGLGLSIARELAALMQGEIDVTSKLGVGSTFNVILPYISNKKVDLSALHKQDVNYDNKLNVKATVLYIEDNHSNIDLVEQVLKAHRPDVNLICHKYGKETVDLAIEHKPDLILFDLDLPDIHGSEVIKKLKQHRLTSDMPVVIISADAMPYRIRSLMKAGAERYLTKPLDVLELLHEVDKYQRK
jgi:PAS domain S-box-containing protein